MKGAKTCQNDRPTLPADGRSYIDLARDTPRAIETWREDSLPSGDEHVDVAVDELPEPEPDKQ